MGGGGGGRGPPPLWSEPGDVASVPLLNSMRTDFSLRGNPAANQRHLRNLWLICSEKSDQTWRLECIYRWTKLSVPTEERSKKLCRICPDRRASYWFCTSPFEAKTAFFFFFFFGIRWYDQMISASMLPAQPRRRRRRVLDPVISVCALMQ